MKKILYAHQYIDSADIDSVHMALKSDWLTQGPKIKEFEDVLYNYAGAKYAVAVSSGTAALHLAMMALGIGKGDEIITSPITFSASANCAVYVGATPRFVDIDDATYHLDIKKLKDFLKVPSHRKKVKAIIPVDFMGTVIDTPAIMKVCDKYGIYIVEDAAHALGAEYRYNKEWLKVGSCRHCDITILSFHPIKHITTGEGGAILTNNKDVCEAALRFRHHGICRVKNKPKWMYDIPQPGFNYRITDFQCALGISQMKKLDKMVNVRRRLVGSYNDAFSLIEEIRLPYEAKDTKASYHLYTIRVPAARRNRLYDYLRGKGILTQVNYIPVHLLSYYKKNFGYKRGDFPVAERYFDECLSLPLHVGLSRQDQKKVIDETIRFFRNE
ncbi:MAG: UDP-4-amino-4,6-dideoxy-N-acetyl-beta-L-altrosamine transaminase [Candidatus Omnitrophota bacterium]